MFKKNQRLINLALRYAIAHKMGKEYWKRVIKMQIKGYK